MTGQSVDEIVQDIMDATGYDVKDLNERGKQLIRLKRRFCNPSSQEYDEQKCAEVDALISQLNQEQQEAKAAMFKQIENLKEAEEDIYSVNLTGKLLYGLRKLL